MSARDRLIWSSHENDVGEPVWEADSAIGDGDPECSWPFSYRIQRYELRGQDIYQDDSDDELLDIDSSSERRIWSTLREAKAALQRDHEAVVARFWKPTQREHFASAPPP